MGNKDLNVLTDEDIVKMAQEGSTTAYEYLINKYRRLAKNKSKRYYIVGGDNEDVVQEGMIGIFKAIRDFDEDKDASFHTFADLCINRQIISAIKSANRQKHQILNEAIFLDDGGDNEDGNAQTLADKLSSRPDTDPENMMLMKEVTQYLSANGNNIFSKFESKVWAEILKGRDYKTISENLGKSPKAVDNALQRIKKKILIFLEN